jgi:hypothetical protein
MREPNPGIPSCALNHRSSRLQQSLFFGILDNIESCSVLDGTSWVHELGFPKDFAAGRVGYVVQADQWGVSNC